MTEPADTEDDDLRARLRGLRVEPPAGDFAASLHLRLSAAGEPDAPGFWRRLRAQIRGVLGTQAPLAWGSAAGVAVCALLVAVGFAQLRAARRPVRELAAPASALAAAAPLASAEFPATKVAMVRINLSAEVAIESAQIRVTLPDGLVFWSDGQELAQRSFEWSQPLRAGDNDIPIAVRGLRAGHYSMTVTAKMGKERVEDDVLLEVVNG